jgi:hypothetical protein
MWMQHVLWPHAWRQRMCQRGGGCGGGGCVDAAGVVAACVAVARVDAAGVAVAAGVLTLWPRTRVKAGQCA